MKIDEYICEGQLNIEGYLADLTPIEYGSRGCNVCWWHKRKKGQEQPECCWNDSYFAKVIGIQVYPSCERFQPSEYVIPKMCHSCKWSNQFKYETKLEYREAKAKHNGYSRAAAEDPLEEPNIYCTHPEGSLNRRTAYSDVTEEGFGIGHWDRQHQWDTCDRWEEDHGPYTNWNFGGKKT